MERRSAPARDDFFFYIDFKTRWIDNDLYGHVNNVVYYSYFDTLIAEFMIQEGGFDPHRDAIVGVAVDTGCRFHASLRYPDRILAGLRVGHLGRTSVRWEIGIFNAAGGPAAASGHFVHVFVERAVQRPVPIPDRLRTAMAAIRVDPAPA